MQFRINMIFGIVLLVGLAQPCIAAKLSGTVRSTNGIPLSNVNIYAGSDSPVTKTIENGTFVFEATWKINAIFISHPGFQSAVRQIDSSIEHYDFVLEPESASTWWIPECSTTRVAGTVLQPYQVGPSLILPKGVKLNKGGWDIDSRVDTIEYGSWWYKQWNTQELEFWLGPSAGGPRPPDYLFEKSKDITLRFWRIKSMKLYGIDAKGTDSKNQRWRHINVGSTSIMYRQASDKAAKFFDGIIDSMCIPPPNMEKKIKIL